MTREKALQANLALYDIEEFEAFIDDIDKLIEEYNQGSDIFGEIELPFRQLLQSELERRKKVLEDL